MILWYEEGTLLPSILLQGKLVVTLGRCGHLCGMYLLRFVAVPYTNDVCCQCGQRDPKCTLCRQQAV